MKISLIVAMATNKVIGQDNKLPRSYGEDLKRFKELTSEHIIVMGSKTYHSIGHPLPNRRNIVLTRSKDIIEGVEIYNSIETLMDQLDSENLPQDEEVFIIGGATIYEQFLEKGDLVYMTEIKKDYEGDTFFPDFLHLYKEIKRESHEQFDFITYQFKS